MHCLGFMLVSPPSGKTMAEKSYNARLEAMCTLMETFNSESEYDWWVIGGRYSGALVYIAMASALYGPAYDSIFRSPKLEQIRTHISSTLSAISKLISLHYGAEFVYEDIDPYASNGQALDALPFTELIWKGLCCEKPRIYVELFDATSGELCHVRNPKKLKKLIGKAWIVVVDLHA